MDAKVLLFIHALSPLHAGTGQGVGSIDLPIAREKATGIPYLPGSSLKGVLRDRARGRMDQETLFAIFGPETDSASEHAGAVQVGDAKLLLLPVRSLYGVFAYATSPYLLERFLREAGLMGIPTPGGVQVAPGQEEVLVAPGSRLVREGKVFLEDLDLAAREEGGLGEWEDWLMEKTQAPVKGRMALLHDDLMAFLLETATEVVARIRLNDETKTVAKKALWYEENLPAESLLYTLVRVEQSFRKGRELHAEAILSLLKGLLEGAMQFGGKATVGRGLCRVRMGG